MLNRTIRRCLLGGVAALSLVVSAGVRADDENPAYKSWASHKPGTSVKMKMESEAAGNKSSSEMTTTLSEVTPEKVVLEMKTVMMAAGQKIETPAVKTEIPAKGAGAVGATPNAPKPDVKESSEDVKIGDKSYKCKVMESKSTTGGNTTTSKTWMSTDVPGMMVKMESKMEGSFSMTSKSEIVEVMEK